MCVSPSWNRHAIFREGRASSEVLDPWQVITQSTSARALQGSYSKMETPTAYVNVTTLLKNKLVFSTVRQMFSALGDFIWVVFCTEPWTFSFEAGSGSSRFVLRCYLVVLRKCSNYKDIRAGNVNTLHRLSAIVLGYFLTILNLNSNFTQNTAILDLGEFVSSSEQIWINLALHHLLTNLLQWMGAIRMRVQIDDKNNQNNPQVILVYQFMYLVQKR